MDVSGAALSRKLHTSKKRVAELGERLQAFTDVSLQPNQFFQANIQQEDRQQAANNALKKSRQQSRLSQVSAHSANISSALEVSQVFKSSALDQRCKVGGFFGGEVTSAKAQENLKDLENLFESRSAPSKAKPTRAELAARFQSRKSTVSPSSQLPGSPTLVSSSPITPAAVDFNSKVKELNDLFDARAAPSSTGQSPQQRKPRSRFYDALRASARFVRRKLGEAIRSRCAAAARLCQSFRAYEKMAQIFSRKEDASGEKGALGKVGCYGLNMIRLCNLAGLRKERNEIDVGVTQDVYSIGVSLVGKVHDGISLVEAGLCSPPSSEKSTTLPQSSTVCTNSMSSALETANAETCKHDQAHTDILHEDGKVVFTGCAYDVVRGTQLALKRVNDVGLASDSLKQALQSVDNAYLPTMNVNALIDMQPEDGKPGFNTAQVVVDGKGTTKRVKFTLLTGILWLDGYTPDNMGRLAILFWLLDPTRTLINSFDGTTEPILLGHLRGSEGSLHDLVAVGDLLKVQPLAKLINKQLSELQDTVFVLSEGPDTVECFGVDIAIHSLDGKAAVRCAGLLGGHGAESQPNVSCYVRHKDQPSNIDAEGKLIVTRGYKDHKHDLLKTLTLVALVEEMWNRVRARCVDKGITGVMLSSAVAEFEKAYGVDPHPSVVAHLVASGTCAVGQLWSLACDVSNVPASVSDSEGVMRVASTNEMRLVAFSILVFARTSVAPIRGAPQLTDSTLQNLEKAFIKMNGEVTEFPFIFINDGQHPRPWPLRLGLPSALPYLVIRSLHSVWKIAHSALSEAVDQGCYIWVKNHQNDPKGQPLPAKAVTTAASKNVAKTLLRTASKDAGVKDIFAENGLTSRKDVLRAIDFYTSLRCQAFFGFSWLSLLHVVRCVAYIYDMKSFDSLPVDYHAYPEVIYGLFSLATVVYFECLVRSADRHCAGYRQDLLLCAFQVEKTRTPVSVLGEDKGEGFLPILKKEVARASRDLKVQLHNMPKDLCIQSAGVAKYCSKGKVESSFLRGAEHTKGVRTANLCNLIFYNCVQQHGGYLGNVHKQSSMLDVGLKQLLDYGCPHFSVTRLESDTVFGDQSAPEGAIVAQLSPDLPYLHLCKCSTSCRDVSCTTKANKSITRAQAIPEVQVESSTPVAAGDTSKVSSDLSTLAFSEGQQVIVGTTCSLKLCLRSTASMPMDGRKLEVGGVEVLCLNMSLGVDAEPAADVSFQPISLSQKSFGDGEYELLVTAPTKAGDHSLCISVDGSMLHAKVTVLPQKPSISTSFVQCSQQKVKVGGLLEMSIALKDAFGNAIDPSMEQKVAFVVSSGGTNSCISVGAPKVANCVAVYPVRMLQAGKFIISIVTGSIVLGTLPLIEVEHESLPCVTFTTISAPPVLYICGPIPANVCLTLRSEANLPLSAAVIHGIEHVSLVGIADCNDQGNLSFDVSSISDASVHFSWAQQTPPSSPPTAGRYTLRAYVQNVEVAQPLSIEVQIHASGLQNICRQGHQLIAKCTEEKEKALSAALQFAKSNDEQAAQARLLEANRLQCKDPAAVEKMKADITRIMGTNIPRLVESYRLMKARFNSEVQKIMMLKELYNPWFSLK